MSETTIIKLRDPLPCGILGNAGLPCGHPATAAYAYPAETFPALYDHPSHWVILPVCEDCARKAAAVYNT